MRYIIRQIPLLQRRVGILRSKMKNKEINKNLEKMADTPHPSFFMNQFSLVPVGANKETEYFCSQNLFLCSLILKGLEWVG